ncbi:MAG: STAS domain-containing protein [Candidatus Woesearchaeota archaeon]
MRKIALISLVRLAREVAITVSSPFEIQESRRPGWARLQVIGELDASTALTFRRRLRTLRAANTHVYVDLSQLEFIDCTGAHALNDAITQAEEGDWQVEVAPDMSVQARRFFDLITATGLPAGISWSPSMGSW